MATQLAETENGSQNKQNITGTISFKATDRHHENIILRGSAKY